LGKATTTTGKKASKRIAEEILGGSKRALTRA
jgi:hypothetical protein